MKNINFFDMVSNIEKVYTVLELNDTVKGLIREQFPDYIWVCGEIQDLRERLHINFNLVQKQEFGNQIIAQTKAVIFANVKPQILRRIKQAGSDFQLKPDIEVKLLCRVDLYSKTGQFSLTVFDIDPVYTLGKIAQNRQRIIEELRKAGLLDKNKEKELPVLPLRIGLITAYNCAAYHDFINELKISNYGFKVFVFDSYMQGRYVEDNVVAALKYFSEFSVDDLDVVVITRGGGSTADLSFFDSKKIAQTIASMKFAVIAALGHHINVTITDMVANLSVKTPTAAAKFLLDKVTRFLADLDYLEESILKKTQRLILDNSKSLETTAVKLESAITRYFREHKEQLLSSKLHIRRLVDMSLAQKKTDIKRHFVDLGTHLHKIFRHSKDKLRHSDEKIKLLNPKNILRRGYSITLRGAKALKSIDNIEIKEIIETVLYNGRIISQVKDKSKD
ncbi:MAG: exodeoxyribonuclease VII large subunit [Candidatus Omnitrophota bacterium]|nr:MAG: exodeoxyribonuclease VII large subunit [Candidatus Omnitrophota bacterium]